ncbi:hypothetical protein K438DRAFT_1552543, partial [Mycena galopus ATCC 62051]
MSLQDISAAIVRFPRLQALNFHGLNQFLRFAFLARQSIAFQQVNNKRPPPVLPLTIQEAIADSLAVSDLALIQTCWAAFKEVVWEHPDVCASSDEIALYNNAALHRNTSFRHIYPPVRVCSNAEC